MRPDEHKKKKSRQYQKKHGADSSESSTGKTTPGSGRTGQLKKQLQTSQKPAVQKPNISQEVKELSADDSETDDTTKRSQRTFQRRHIDSNWSRYEGIDDESNANSEAQKAADFQLLLNKVVTAESQLRLHDEKDWEEAEESIAKTDTNFDAQFLAIDCSELSRIIQTVPLPIRYDIEREADQAGFLTMYEERCKKAREFPSSNQTVVLKSSRPDSSSIVDRMHLNVKTTPEKLAQTSNILDNLSEISRELKGAKRCDTNAANVLSQNTAELTEEEKYSRSFWIGDEPDIVVDDDNAVDEVAKNSDHCSKHSFKCCDKDTNATADMDDLDFLLTLVDKPQLPSPHIPTSPESPHEKVKVNKKSDEGVKQQNTVPVHVTSSAVKENVADLEDWLDSVLDD
ncbi:uncharacterized protein LOC141906407 [Tubulanus polymorphus]|uniref:uncharacterized protein LOC141906407 n=1 Tax=Tubulanus polymorphus TaxID=672921 RepID=UPI003DA4AD7A